MASVARVIGSSTPPVRACANGVSRRGRAQGGWRSATGNVKLAGRVCERVGGRRGARNDAPARSTMTVISTGPVIGSPYALVSPFLSSVKVTSGRRRETADARAQEDVRALAAEGRHAVVEDVVEGRAGRHRDGGAGRPGHRDGRVRLGDGRVTDDVLDARAVEPPVEHEVDLVAAARGRWSRPTRRRRA